LEVVEQLCDEVAIINNGELLFYGTLQDMKETYESDDQSLEQVFLELTSNE
jgi:ABC-2 type transport system ATP-binding protein